MFKNYETQKDPIVEVSPRKGMLFKKDPNREYLLRRGMFKIRTQ